MANTYDQQLIDYFQGKFEDQPYYQSTGFQDLLSRFTSNPQHYLQNRGNVDTWIPVIKGYGDTFSQMFENTVGRAPSPEEYDKFFSSVVTPNWIRPIDPNQLRQETTGLMDQFFRRTAENEALARAEEKAAAAVAPDSQFEQWAQQYRKGISDTETALADYQTRLMEKIRPQLIQSLHTQGLLNTGALNEALAGAGKDLSEESQRFILGARGAAEQDIANRRYQIASAPGSYDLSREFNVAPGITASGQQALQNVWANLMQDRSFEHQKELANMSRTEEPSFLSQYGGLILGGIGAGLGGSLGGAAGSGLANLYKQRQT